jgi:hypothetical protein
LFVQMAGFCSFPMAEYALCMSTTFSLPIHVSVGTLFHTLAVVIGAIMNTGV